MFPANSGFKIGVAYVIITTVLFLFPPELPVTGSNMSMYLSLLLFPDWSHFIHRLPLDSKAASFVALHLPHDIM